MRQAFVESKLREADAGRALNVASSTRVQFGEGFSPLSFDPSDDFHNHAFRWMGQNAHVRLKTTGGPMRLVMRGWVHEKIVQSKVVLTFFVDGAFVAATGPVEDEHFSVETVVPPEQLRRPWVDLTVRTSAVAFHWADPPELKVIVVYGFEWSEAR